MLYWLSADDLVMPSLQVTKGHTRNTAKDLSSTAGVATIAAHGLIVTAGRRTLCWGRSRRGGDCYRRLLDGRLCSCEGRGGDEEELDDSLHG